MNLLRLTLGVGLLGLVAAFATGCLADDGEGAGTSIMGGQRGVDRAAIAFDKESVQLEGTWANSQTIETFLVMNHGNETLEIGPPQVRVLRGCDAVQSVNAGIEVPPKEAVHLPIQFGPHRESGAHEVLVDVPSNDPKKPTVTLRARVDVQESDGGSFHGPRLRVDKELIDIGVVPFDWPMYEQFVLRNHGDEVLILEEAPAIRTLEGC